MASRNVPRGQFATTSTFTPDAIAFGTANSIKLHDLAGLLDLMAKRTPEQQQALLEVALEGDYWRHTCVNCGVKMVDRPARQGGQPFWGGFNASTTRSAERRCRCGPADPPDADGEDDGIYPDQLFDPNDPFPTQ